jgi:hypothetical protein
VIVHALRFLPDYPSCGTTFVSNEHAKRTDCDCRVLVGVKVTNGQTSAEDIATVAIPCKPAHKPLAAMATKNIGETIGDPTLRGKPLIEVVDAMLMAVPAP